MRHADEWDVVWPLSDRKTRIENKPSDICKIKVSISMGPLLNLYAGVDKKIFYHGNDRVPHQGVDSIDKNEWKRYSRFFNSLCWRSVPRLHRSAAAAGATVLNLDWLTFSINICSKLFLLLFLPLTVTILLALTKGYTPSRVKKNKHRKVRRFFKCWNLCCQ